MNHSPLHWMLLPLRRFAQFSGRSCRAEYWWFYVTTILALIITYVLGLALRLPVITGVVVLLISLPFSALTSRRLHDTDHSGWWVLPANLAGLLFAGSFIGWASGLFDRSGFMTVTSGLAAIVLGGLLRKWLRQAGTSGPNRFGPDPLVEPGRPTPGQ